MFREDSNGTGFGGDVPVCDAGRLSPQGVEHSSPQGRRQHLGGGGGGGGDTVNNTLGRSLWRGPVRIQEQHLVYGTAHEQHLNVDHLPLSWRL